MSNKYSLPVASLSALSFSILMGSNPNCNPLVIQGDEGASSQPYVTKYDNPTISAVPTLKSPEYAIRGTGGFGWYGFTAYLNETATSANGQGAVAANLPAEPPTETLEVPMSDLLRMTANGSQIGYQPLSLQAEIVGVSGDQNIPQGTMEVALDPTVMLVPLQVIRAVPCKSAGRNDPTCPNTDNSQVSELLRVDDSAWKYYFDLLPQYSVKNFISDNNDINFRTFAGPLNDNVPSENGPAGTPDNIWRAAGIQFRMIDCNPDQPGQGCPALVDNANTFPCDFPSLNPPGCGTALAPWNHLRPQQCQSHGGFAAGNYPMPTQLVEKARQLPGVVPGLPILVITSSVNGFLPDLGGTECGDDGIEVARIGQWAVAAVDAQPPGGVSPQVLSHELGHILGLDDINPCVTAADQANLMCNVGFSGTQLNATQIATARATAAGFVSAKWGVTVTP